MTTSVRIAGDKVFIGSKQYKRIAARNRADAVEQSKKAASCIDSALSMHEGFFRNGIGEYVEVFATPYNQQGKVVCNALYDISGKPVGYIRFQRDNGRSDSAQRGLGDSFYCLKEGKKLPNGKYKPEYATFYG